MREDQKLAITNFQNLSLSVMWKPDIKARLQSDGATVWSEVKLSFLHATTAYKVVQAQLQQFLISVLDIDKWQFQAPAALPAGKKHPVSIE